jgi:hypothetical protein
MRLSQPVANCSSNASTSVNATLQARSVARVSDEFYTSVINFGKELGERYEKTIGGRQDVGPHMSTAINARDMLSITNAFAETENGKRASKPSHLLNQLRYLPRPDLRFDVSRKCRQYGLGWCGEP